MTALLVAVAAALLALVVFADSRAHRGQTPVGADLEIWIRDSLATQLARDVPCRSLALVACYWLVLMSILYATSLLDGLVLTSIGLILGGFVVAILMRHLNELSHHAVHGSLSRSKLVNQLVCDALFAFPMGKARRDDRHRHHVQVHHRVATWAGDPNVDELERAASGTVLRAGFYPVTPAGLLAELKSLVVPGVVGRRAWGPIALGALVYLTAGSNGLIVLLGARFVWFPWLSWLSLLGEHDWRLPAEAGTTSPSDASIEREQARCVRVYSDHRTMALLARLVWLPFGDSYHYAHSVAPGLRWNYLRSLDTALPEVLTVDRLVTGSGSVAYRLARAEGNIGVRN